MEYEDQQILDINDLRKSQSMIDDASILYEYENLLIFNEYLTTESIINDIWMHY